MDGIAGLLWWDGWTGHGLNSLRFECIRRNCNYAACRACILCGAREGAEKVDVSL
jgi:hypothetical protein